MKVLDGLEVSGDIIVNGENKATQLKNKTTGEYVNFFISKNEPTNVSNGDLWFQIIDE